MYNYLLIIVIIFVIYYLSKKGILEGFETADKNIQDSYGYLNTFYTELMKEPLVYFVEPLPLGGIDQPAKASSKEVKDECKTLFDYTNTPTSDIKKSRLSFKRLDKDPLKPFMNILGSAFSSVVFYNINPILLIKKKISSDEINFEMKFPELQAEIDSLKFANELTNILNKEIVFSLPIRPFFEFIFTDEDYFKYCVDFELFNNKEKELIEIIKSDDYKEIIISKANNGTITIKSSYEKEVKEEKAKEIKKLLGLNQYEKAEVIFRNDKHLIINKTITQKIES